MGNFEILSRSNFLSFIKYLDPNYEIAKHHFLIGEALQQIANGQLLRLIVEAPPRHGKSREVSELFPPYYLGLYPDREIIFGTYQQKLSRRTGGKVRNMLASNDYAHVFPETKIAKDSRAKDFFNTTKKGQLLATSVEGPATGFGGHLVILDDTLKGRKQAESEAYRQALKDFYDTTIRTRLYPGAAIIIMQTRWHEDDLIGHVLKEYKHENWKRLTFPALNKDETKSLWPNRYSLQMMLDIKAGMSSYDWNAVYMQRPYALQGNLFKKEYWRYYRQADLPRYFDEIIQSWDMAFKDKIENDWVVGLVMARKGANYYVLDCVRKHLDYKGSKIAVVQMTSRWPLAKRKFVEDKANGPAIISDLKDHIPGLIEYNPEDQSKIARSLAVVHNVEAQNVYLPHPDEAFWVKEFIAELAKFPNGAHDDQVDAFTQGLNRLELAGSAIRNYEALTRR